MPNPIYDIGYRYATQRYTLDGSTIDFEFNFDGGYISEDYVKAFWKKPDLSEEEIDRSDITFVGPNQLRIPLAAEQSVLWKLIIRRDTPKNMPLVDFTDGSILNERNLDKNTKQSIHDVAELVDFIADLLQEWRDLYSIVYDFLEQFNDISSQITEINNLINNLQDDIDNLTNRLDNLKFTDLVDTPNSYEDQAHKIPSVKATEDGIEFKTIQEVLTEAGVDTGGLEDAPNDGKKYVRGSDVIGPGDYNDNYWGELKIESASDYYSTTKRGYSQLTYDVGNQKFKTNHFYESFSLCDDFSVVYPGGMDACKFYFTVQRGFLDIGGTPTLCPTNKPNFSEGNIYTKFVTAEISTDEYPNAIDMANKVFYSCISKSTGEGHVLETVPSTDDYYLLYKSVMNSFGTQVSQSYDMRAMNAPESTGGGGGTFTNNLMSPDPDTTTGLTWGYKGGRYINDYTGINFDVEDGTITLTDNATNYVTIWGNDLINSVIINAYTNIDDIDSLDTLIATIDTAAGEIVSYTDERIPFSKKQRRSLIPYDIDDYNSYDNCYDVFAEGKEDHGSVVVIQTNDTIHKIKPMNYQNGLFGLTRIHGTTYADNSPKIWIKRSYININNGITLCPVIGGDELGTEDTGFSVDFAFDDFPTDNTYYFSILKADGKLKVTTAIPSVTTHLLLYGIPVVSGKIDYAEIKDYRSTWTSINALEASAYTNKEVFTCTFDGTPSDVAVDSEFTMLVPFDCKIVKWAAVSTTVGSIIVDVLKETNHLVTSNYVKFDNTVESTFSSITGSVKPNIDGYATAGIKKGQDTTLTGWTLDTLQADTLLKFKVSSCTGIKKVTLFLTVEKQ